MCCNGWSWCSHPSTETVHQTLPHIYEPHKFTDADGSNPGSAYDDDGSLGDCICILELANQGAELGAV
jgi:hypothetical protein